MSFSDFPFLSKTEFEKVCGAFITELTTKHHGWQLKCVVSQWGSITDTLLELRFRRTLLTPFPEDASGHQYDVPIDTEEDLEALPPALPCPNAEVEIIYNVLYSPNYRVPVLYFTPSLPLSAHGLAELLLPETGKGFVIGTVSQGEHLISGEAWWFVHPCRTGEAMAEWREMVKSEAEYLTVWLGLMGGAIGVTDTTGAGFITRHCSQ